MAGLGTNVGTSFYLRARMNGYITLDGASVPVWYFTDSSSGPSGPGFMGDRQLPSAHIEPIEGQPIDVTFYNHSPMDHTIHLHGLDVDQQNDGVPATSFAVPPMGSYTYQFVAPHAGTYHYHCHVDTVLHYAKGMIGTVIVRPPDGATDRAWNGGPTFDEEVLWHLHSVDKHWSQSYSQSGPGTARYHATHFLLNGKETVDALDDPFTRLVLGQGQRGYLRVLNADFSWTRVTLGGLPFEIVASDGRPYPAPVTATELEVGPGERYDLLVTAPARAGTWIAQVAYLNEYEGGVRGTAQTRIQVV